MFVGACVCVLQTVRGRGGKKARVLKCHITQHGNYAHDMRCVSPHHHRPLSMCRTGPQPSTCTEDMHEIYTGMSLYRSPRVGNATLITFFFSFFVMLSAIIPPVVFVIVLTVCSLLSQRHKSIDSYMRGSRGPFLWSVWECQRFKLCMKTHHSLCSTSQPESNSQNAFLPAICCRGQSWAAIFRSYICHFHPASSAKALFHLFPLSPIEYAKI